MIRLRRPTLRFVLSRLTEELAHCHGRARRSARTGGEDLLAWGRKYLPAHFQRPPSAMHRWLAAELGEIQRARGVKLNVLGPRGGAKSTVGTLAFVLRAATEGAEPYIWIVSDTRRQACAHLENIKAELTDNALLAAGYPRAAGRGSVWRAGMIVLRNGVCIEALSTGQRIRGRRRREHRPTLIVADDLQNDGHMRSAVERERSRQWFHGALMKAGTPRTHVLHLATALHHEALAMELDRTPGWRSRVFRAIVRWPREMSLWAEWESLYCAAADPHAAQRAEAFYRDHCAAMHEGAEVLWPAEEDLYTLMRQRAEGGHAAFEREKQNSPIDPEACEWPESYFHESLWFDEWPGDLWVRTMALDPSKGADARRGDFSALAMVGVDRRGMVYVEADLARRPTPEMVATAVECCRRFRPHVFGIEANQFQDLLANEFAALARREGVLAAPPYPLHNHVAKVVRIRRLGPYLAGRRLRFKSRSPGTKLLVEQLRQFPAADHDDGPDALEMGLRLAAEMIAGGASGPGWGARLGGTSMFPPARDAPGK